MRLETPIRAPAPLCFDLAIDVDAHVGSAGATGERAIAGVTTGLLTLGDEVTFEAVHFGVRLRLTSRIVVFERPRRFIDEMVRGQFRRLRHLHEFHDRPDGTLMVDEMEFASPLGPLGSLADALFVTRHLRRFLERRNAWLRAEAERRAAGR